MKVLLFNGSPHKTGCTYTALMEAGSILEAQGIETEIIQVGANPVRGCIACGGCAKGRGCVFGDQDGLNAVIEKCRQADGFLFGSPVYYASPNGSLVSFLDRLFYAGGAALAHKPAACVTSARRAGTTATLDMLQKYLTINQMPIVSSTYWPMVHGGCAEDAKLDLEGMQVMRNLGRNMAWLLQCIEAGKAAGIQIPKAEREARTNFIR